MVAVGRLAVAIGRQSADLAAPVPQRHPINR